MYLELFRLDAAYLHTYVYNVCVCIYIYMYYIDERCVRLEMWNGLFAVPHGTRFPKAFFFLPAFSFQGT